MRTASHFKRLTIMSTALQQRSLLILAMVALLLGPLSGVAAEKTVYTPDNGKNFDVEHSRRIDTTFTLGSSPKIFLDNRYGDILINTWERSDVRVLITVRVRGKDNKSTSKSFEQIDFGMTSSSGKLNLSTLIGNKSQGTVKRFFQDVTPFDKSKVDIDYELSVPLKASLNIKNKFGNVFAENLGAPLELDLSYGGLRTSRLPVGSHLHLAFGRTNISEAPNSSIVLVNGELDIEKAEILHLKSTSSEVEITSGGVIELESSRDRLRLGTIDELNGSAVFTDLEVDVLNNKADLELRLGVVDFDKLSPELVELKLDEKNTDVAIRIDNLPFQLHAFMEGGKLILPQDAGPFTSKLEDESKEVRTIEGVDGEGPFRTRIIIKGKGGEFFFYR